MRTEGPVPGSDARMTAAMNDVDPPQIPDVTALARIDGAAAVFRGQQANSGRGVAVKILPAPLDRNGRAAYEAERSRIGRLRHVPAILQVDEVGTLPDGRPYLTTELCTESLADRLRRGKRLEPNQIAELGRELAEALAAAHEVEIVHGSITPRNVLFRRDGRPALSDFGVALRELYPGDPTDSGEFAAPETLRDGSLTTRSDLYGLGATLYAALTGGPPFPSKIGEHPSERILRVISEPAPPVAAPPELATLLAELLATRAEDRPGDAAGVADRFAALIGTKDESQPEPIPTSDAVPETPTEPSTDWSGLLDDVLYDGPATSPSTPAPSEPTPRPRRRRGPWLLGGGAVAAVLLAALVGNLFSGGHSHKPPLVTATATSPSTPPPGRSPVPAVRLRSVQDAGRSVLLRWTGSSTLSYAVVIAEPGQTTAVVLAHHARSFRVAVTPGRQYCFLVQATDGQHVTETDPRPIRGAVCRT